MSRTPIVYEVATGTIINLGKEAFKRALPKRHHGFIGWTRPGGTAYIVAQKRTTYGGEFLVVIPVTGKDPAKSGMLQRLWLSVHTDDLPKLQRTTHRVTDEERVNRLRRRVAEYESVYTR